MLGEVRPKTVENGNRGNGKTSNGDQKIKQA